MDGAYDMKTVEKALETSINRREEMTKENIKKAEQIGFKNIPDKIVITDQYGFIKDDKEKGNNINTKQLNIESPQSQKISVPEDKESRQLRILRENARLEKWNKMLSNFNEFYKDKFNKLKERTRKGVPDSLRGLIWQILADIDKYRNDNSLSNMYNTLVNEEESDIATESVILRDIDRTFPKHTFFKDKYGLGQRSLFNVLRAYSKFNADTGYVQGMGFITALMLTYMDEESTFWMIHSLMYKYNMKEFYFRDFPGLEKSFYILLRLMKKHLNKVYEHFKKKEIHPTMYASQWFITIFAVNFKFDVLVRIFDVFLLEREKILYRIGLAILKMSEEKIIAAKNFEDTLGLVKSLFDNINVEDLFAKAFKFSISKDHLAEYEGEYEMEKNNLNDEIVKQVKIN